MLWSVSVRIMIFTVSRILVTSVAKSTLGTTRNKTDPAAKTVNYFCILSISNLTFCLMLYCFQSLQSMNQLHHVGFTLPKPFEFLRASPVKRTGTRLASHTPLHWIRARIKVKHLLKVLSWARGCTRGGSCQMSCEGEAWEAVPKTALFHTAEPWESRLKGRKEWCFPKDLTMYRTEAPVYSQDAHRRKTPWDCTEQGSETRRGVCCQLPSAFVHATQLVFGLEVANRPSRWGKSWLGREPGWSQI